MGNGMIVSYCLIAWFVVIALDDVFEKVAMNYWLSSLLVIKVDEWGSIAIVIPECIKVDGLLY